MIGCSFFHVHIPRKTQSNRWQKCRCGMWRWRSGYTWQPEPVDERDTLPGE